MARVSRNFFLFARPSLVNIKCISRSIKLVDSGDVAFAKPPTYNFYNNGFGLLRSLFDDTVSRFNENTKVIAVEGNICSGKSHVASKLAEKFGMVHFPDATEDDIYLLRSHNPPFDLRSHNVMLPDFAKYYTTEMFWNQTDLAKNGKPLYLQKQYYIRRYWNYLKALCNLVNTGRGFVTDRSPFSDIAFVDAMHKCGYLTEPSLRWFKQHHGLTARTLWKPHLIIYVKASNKQIREAIKRRNIPWEVNAPNLTDRFLDALAESLEKYYLPRMSRYSEILTIDRSHTDIDDDDDLTIIAQKISEMDFEGHKFLRDDYKFLEWRLGLHDDRAKINARAIFSDSNACFSKVFADMIIPMDLKEGIYSHEARELQAAILQLDERTRIPAVYNVKYNSLFNICFNPRLAKTNYMADLPKNHLWN